MDDQPNDRLTTAELVRRTDFTLGLASISPSTRAIRGPAGEASLEPRAMQVLLALADAGGAVVSRDEIFRRCWGAAVVGDDSLNRAIADIRRAARIAGGDFAIETVPRTGYRLVAGGEEARSKPGRRATRRLLIMGPAALGAAGALAWWASSARRGGRSQVAALLQESDQALRSGLPEGAGHAVELLERAVAVEPRNAEAWGRLALAQCSLADASPPGQSAAVVAGVEAAARRALALDPRQADALGALAILPPYFGDWLAAERRMDAVLAVDPGHLPTLDARSFLHVCVGRARKASLDRIGYAARDPLNPGQQYRLIYAYWIAGRVGEADRAADRTLQLWPKHPGAWFGRLWTLAFTGRADRALAHIDDAAARPRLPDWMVETLRASMAAIDSGRPADADVAVRRLLAEVSQGPSNAINAILMLNGMGRVEQALDVADAYLLEEGPLMASVRWRAGQVSVNDQRRRKTNMLFVPVSAAMRQHPRFAVLTRRIGLDDYWRRSGTRLDV